MLNTKNVKFELEEILKNDTSYNKSATRYLYKRYPALWESIMNLTSFLPEDAMPKQRIWHILNAVDYSPLCPITGTKVKWFENRYLGTADRSSCNKLLHKNGHYDHIYNPEVNQKRSIGIKLARANGRGKRPKSSYTKEDRIKSRNTCMQRYGVTNGSKTNEARLKISQSRVRNGASPPHLRSEFEHYKQKVRAITEDNWQKHQIEINPSGLRRNRTNTLDHIFSICSGFANSIPPYIIGHYTNLRMMDLQSNSKKGAICEKSADELFNDFFKCGKPIIG